MRREDFRKGANVYIECEFMFVDVSCGLRG